MQIFAAPIALAVSKLTKPIGPERKKTGFTGPGWGALENPYTLLPAPHIRTLSPNVIFARRQACTATLKGSKSAPSSNDTWSGSLKQKIMIKYQGPTTFNSLLVAEVGRMLVIASERSIVGRRSAKFNTSAKIVLTTLAKIANPTWDTRFYCHSISCKRWKSQRCLDCNPSYHSPTRF